MSSAQGVSAHEGPSLPNVTAFTCRDLNGSIVIVASHGEPSAEVAASVVARSVRSADVNRDGLGDLILVGANGIEVLLAVAAAPLGGRL